MVTEVFLSQAGLENEAQRRAEAMNGLCSVL